MRLLIFNLRISQWRGSWVGQSDAEVAVRLEAAPSYVQGFS